MNKKASIPAELKERHITVKAKYFQRTHGYVEAPEIVVAGLYLEKIGFTIGSKVTIIERPKEIVITLDEAQPAKEELSPYQKTLARKMAELKSYYRRGPKEPQPLKEVLVNYLKQGYPGEMEEIISKFLSGEMSDTLQNYVIDLLTNDRYSPAEQLTRTALVKLELAEPVKNNAPRKKRQSHATQSSPT